jgi:hypothetical protein
MHNRDSLAKDRGCTFPGCTSPGCTAPGYQCQVHHAETDWADGGLTNIDEETLACGPHNRLVKPGGWRTRKLPAAEASRGVRAGQRQSARR